MKRLLTIAFLTLAAVLMTPVPTFAATTMRSITESQINISYWVTNPGARGVTNRSVDLQPGRVVVSETWTRRNTQPKQVVVTLIPSVQNGRVLWSLDSATVDGAAASAELQKQINERISSSWRNYAKKHNAKGRITAVTITDDAISYTLETK